MAQTDQKLAKLLSDESFVRWINGRAGTEEKKRWEEWERKSASHAALIKQARILFNLPWSSEDGTDMKKEVARLHKRLDNRKRLSGNIRLYSGRRGYIRWAKIAAIILVAVGVTASAFLTGIFDSKTEPSYTTLEASHGEKASLKLNDGSLIRLNSNSAVRYNPEQLSTNSVEVWLKGEAYFSIVKKPNEEGRTFKVHTREGDIHVLGTRFNVNTRYQRTTVILEEGRTEVFLRDSLCQIRNQKIMKPGEKALLASSLDTIPLQKVDTSLYTAWLDGKLVFDDTALKEIVQTIESTYGITMNVADPDLLNKEISGSLQNPDLETLLEGLEKVLKLNFKQKAEDEFWISRQKSFQEE